MCYRLIQKMNIKINILVKSEAYYTSDNQQPQKILDTSTILKKYLFSITNLVICYTTETFVMSN